MCAKLSHSFEDMISVDNLLFSWEEFIRGKRRRKDVQQFSFNLMNNVLKLHYELKNKKYRHGRYHAFTICDPKPRKIHKASVRDRLVHRAVYRVLQPFFEKTFISESYSCRQNKGTHKAIERFASFNYKASENNTKTCWVLKCDIKKFFASIDQKNLVKILRQYILDEEIIWLLKQIVSSFHSSRIGVGLPLGNLTSQTFVNIYMNEFDQFVKHKLRIKRYIRYADDFAISSKDKSYLLKLLPQLSRFLEENLRLSLHSGKTFITTLFSGVDFLGWVNFPDHRVLRTKTKRRMLARIKENPTEDSVNSYLSLLDHGNSCKLKKKVIRLIYEFQRESF